MAQTTEWTLRTAGATYRTFDLVAAGAFGSVYFARNLTNGTAVAVKLLHPHHARDPRVVARFEGEAQLARSLVHSNVVRVLDHGRAEDGLPFIVMEWVTGWTVDALIRQRGAFPTGEAATIICQVLAGLEAARQRGIVHRDIKPLNLMVTPEGLVKVMDFGIAKASDLAAVSGSVGAVGTPAYMAPEQFREEPLDSRTDLYALGVTLYQMLTGQVPFRAESTAGLMYHHLNTPPPPLASVRADINPNLAAIVQRALAKRPDDRFPTPAAMLAALRPFASRPVAAPPPAAGPTQALSDSPAPPIPRTAAPRRPTILIVALAMAVLVAGGVVARELLLPETQPAAPPTARPTTPATVTPAPAISGPAAASAASPAATPIAGAAQSTPLAPTAGPPTPVPPTRASPTDVPPPTSPPFVVPPTVPPTTASAEQFVREYYRAIDQRRYRDAYNYLSRAAQTRLSYADFERQFSQTLVSIGVRFVDAISIAGQSSTLAAHTTTVSRGGARDTTECWRVDWQLVLEDGRWKRETIRQVAEGC